MLGWLIWVPVFFMACKIVFSNFLVAAACNLDGVLCGLPLALAKLRSYVHHRKYTKCGLTMKETSKTKS